MYKTYAKRKNREKYLAQQFSVSKKSSSKNYREASLFWVILLSMGIWPDFKIAFLMRFFNVIGWKHVSYFMI